MRYVKLVMKVMGSELWMGFEAPDHWDLGPDYLNVDDVDPERFAAMKIDRWVSLAEEDVQSEQEM